MLNMIVKKKFNMFQWMKTKLNQFILLQYILSVYRYLGQTIKMDNVAVLFIELVDIKSLEACYLY